MRDFEIKIKCDVCGIQTGDSLILNTRFWDEKTGLNEDGKHWKDDYADFRHKTCEDIHGNFSEMVEEARIKMKITENEAEDFVKKNRKKSDFDKELKKHYHA